MPRVQTPLWYRAYFSVQEGVESTVWERILSHGRLLPTLQKEFLKEWVAGAEWLVQGGGGISQI